METYELCWTLYEIVDGQREKVITYNFPVVIIYSKEALLQEMLSLS